MLDPRTPDSNDLVADFHLLGRLNFDHYLSLQRRLMYEAANSDRRRITVLVCEHDELITVGRRGSRAHVQLTNEQLGRRRLNVQWVNRGGGCILHGPGQLAVYPIVPLGTLDWSTGELRRRLGHGLCQVLADLQVSIRSQTDDVGVWGRSGLLAAVGISRQQGVSGFGAAINVNPPMSHYAYVQSVPADQLPAGQRGTMSCLLAERRLPVRMQQVRAALVARLAEAFSCQRHHIHSGHPWLRSVSETSRERISHAS